MAKQYGLVIDLERCIGCHTCTIACKLENGLEKGKVRKCTLCAHRVDEGLEPLQFQLA